MKYSGIQFVKVHWINYASAHDFFFWNGNKRTVRHIDGLSVIHWCYKIVHYLVEEYGYSYGRRMMQGGIYFLLGVTAGAVSKRKVLKALKNLALAAH